MPSTVATSSEAPTPQLAPIATGWVPSEAVECAKGLGRDAHHGAAVGVEAHGGDERQSRLGGTFDGGAQFFLGRHGFNPQHVNAALLQGHGLFLEGGDAFLMGHGADGHEDFAGGADGAADINGAAGRVCFGAGVARRRPC